MSKFCACGCGKELTQKMLESKLNFKYLPKHKKNEYENKLKGRLCACGCGNYININKWSNKNVKYINYHYSKTPKSKVLKSKKLKNRIITKEHRTKISIALKGRKLSPETKRKLSEYNKKNAKRRITSMDEVEHILVEFLKNNKHSIRREFLENEDVNKKLGFRNTIRKFLKNNNTTLDELANKHNISFINKRGTKVGKNENEILEQIEFETNVILKRNYFVDKYFIDGYDIKNNIAYEVDEEHHKFQIEKDKVREDEIKNILNCDFVRIRDGW
jgi:very-short-patch-repair endonuclease